MLNPDDKHINILVRQFVRELKNVIRRENVRHEDLYEIYDTIGELLSQREVKILLERFPNTAICDIQESFLYFYYSDILECLTKLFTVEFMTNAGSRRAGFTLDDVFIKGEAVECFCVLCKSVADNSRGYKIQKCVQLLERFLELNRLSDLLWSQCHQKELPLGARDDSLSGYQTDQWEILTTYIVTVPERVSNKLHAEMGELFFPDNYIPLVCKAVLRCCEKIHGEIKHNTDCGILFICHLLGKLCMSGHGERVWSQLMPEFQQRVTTDMLWCRVCERLVCGVPDRYMESTVTTMVLKIPWFELMTKFLGHSVLENHKVRFLLTNKLLLLRYFKKPLILQNILGYLSSSATLKPLFVKTVTKLLDVWSDKSALKHTSYDQHLYITKAVMIATAFIGDKHLKEIQEEVMKRVMVGVGTHLDSTLPQVRRQGMIVAESLTAKFNVAGEKLKFEYDEDKESEELKRLLIAPPEPSEVLEEVQQKMADSHLTEVKVSEQDTSKTDSDKTQVEDLDSDDDFEPYDLSNDKKQTKNKPPVFIRECMEGLISSGEDPEKFEVCLEVAEQLIRQHRTSAVEVSVEFVKLLLHLQDRFSLPGYFLQRHKAMVALLVTDPLPISEYLTEQFYERNYNIRQRLDILEVLCDSAKELSSPSGSVEKCSGKARVSQTWVDESSISSNLEDWKEIVQKRIDSKTRRFASKRSDHEMAKVANRFAPVAGHFFFSLLTKFDRKENTMDMLGEDHLVLNKLIYTLGVIMFQAQHAPVSKNIGKALLEFIWVLRYHPQPAVRQALLFSTSMVLLTLPPHIIFNDLQDQILETKIWLQDVAEKDTDHDCQKMAVQGLIVIENNVKQQFSKVA